MAESLHGPLCLSRGWCLLSHVFGRQNTVVVVGSSMLLSSIGPIKVQEFLTLSTDLKAKAPYLIRDAATPRFQDPKGARAIQGLEKQWRRSADCRPVSFQAASPIDVETVGEALLCLSSATIALPRSPSTLLADGPILKHRACQRDLLLGPPPPPPDPLPSHGRPGVCGHEGLFSTRLNLPGTGCHGLMFMDTMLAHPR